MENSNENKNQNSNHSKNPNLNQNHHDKFQKPNSKTNFKKKKLGKISVKIEFSQSFSIDLDKIVDSIIKALGIVDEAMKKNVKKNVKASPLFSEFSDKTQTFNENGKTVNKRLNNDTGVAGASDKETKTIHFEELYNYRSGVKETVRVEKKKKFCKNPLCGKSLAQNVREDAKFCSSTCRHQYFKMKNDGEIKI